MLQAYQTIDIVSFNLFCHQSKVEYIISERGAWVMDKKKAYTQL